MARQYGIPKAGGITKGTKVDRSPKARVAQNKKKAEGADIIFKAFSTSSRKKGK